MPKNTKTALATALDALLCALIVTALGYDSLRFVLEAPQVLPRVLPPVLSLWLSIATALGLALFAWRKRPGAPRPKPGDVLRRSAGCLLATCTLGILMACAWALGPITLPALFGAMFALAVGAVWIGAPVERGRVAAVLTCCLLLASLPLAPWPLYLTTALSRPALDDVAERVEAGHVVRAPQRVGLLLVHRSELRGATPFLVTSPDASGAGGLARSPAAKVEGDFNLWSSFALGRPWYAVFED